MGWRLSYKPNLLETIFDATAEKIERDAEATVFKTVCLVSFQTLGSRILSRYS